MREQLKELTKQYDKSENDLKALQSVGQVTLLLYTNKTAFFLLILYVLGIKLHYDMKGIKMLPTCIE